MRAVYLTKPRVCFVLAASLILLHAGCRSADAGKNKSESAPQARNPLEVTIKPTVISQIKAGEPALAEVSGSLRVPGRVEADETRVTRVGSPVTGRITELDVLEGQTVKRGQVIASLHSTELSHSQLEFLKAYSQQQLAHRAAVRAKQLLKADVIGEAELQRREAELVQATAELSSAHDELKVLGMEEDAIGKLQATRTVNSLSHIVASRDGTVLERKVTVGQVVQSTDTVVVLADLSHLWLVADLPEQTAGHIAVGKSAEAEIAALPGHVIKGKLAYVSATVNPETRTVRIRMDLPNPKGGYKPAMLATMVLLDSAEKQYVIPSSAIVREENREHVFVQTGPATFELRQVTLGAEFGDRRVYLDGLRQGEKIALDGAFHLNNERKHSAAQVE